jgi:hypothetical protein
MQPVIIIITPGALWPDDIRITLARDGELSLEADG